MGVIFTIARKRRRWVGWADSNSGAVIDPNGSVGNIAIKLSVFVEIYADPRFLSA